jgi:hypothetical protein
VTIYCCPIIYYLFVVDLIFGGGARHLVGVGRRVRGRPHSRAACCDGRTDEEAVGPATVPSTLLFRPLSHNTTQHRQIIHKIRKRKTCLAAITVYRLAREPLDRAAAKCATRGQCSVGLVVVIIIL